jgi:hypothetical protein
MKQMSKIEFNEKMIWDYLNGLLEELENEKAKFVEDIQKSPFHPSHAIQWHTDDLVIAEVQARLAHEIFRLGEEDSMDLLEACKDRLERCKEDLLNNHGGSSTNPISNAIDLFDREGKSRFVKRMSMYVDRLESLLEEEKEAEERKENVTDTTVYALKAQYATLINQLSHFTQQEKNYTTKRDKLAAQTAANAINKSIANLAELAEDLGVEIV